MLRKYCSDMKILQAVLSFEKGGRTRRIVDLSTGLEGRGHNVVFFALSSPPDWIQKKHPMLSSTLTLGGRNRGKLLNILDFVKLVRKVRPDVIHAHCATSRLLAAAATLLTGIPSTGTFHHSILEPYADKPSNWIVAKLLSHVVAISSNRQRMMMDNLGLPTTRVTLIHGGTEVEPLADTATREQYRQQLGIKPDTLALLSLGHLGWIKGHDYVLEAMGAVVQRTSNVHLYIGGQGAPEDIERLKGLIEKYGLQQHVTLLGEVIPKPWYDASDIFVLASIEEGFGLVFIEAASRRLPVVATDTGGISDIVVNAETGLLVPIRDSQAIATALLSLLENTELRARCGVAARKRVEEHFLVDHMVGKYLNVYQQIAGRR
jgi:glycosyltransferase involved in cell wall biosynthesis